MEIVLLIILLFYIYFIARQPLDADSYLKIESFYNIENISRTHSCLPEFMNFKLQKS